MPTSVISSWMARTVSFGCSCHSFEKNPERARPRQVQKGSLYSGLRLLMESIRVLLTVRDLVVPARKERGRES